MTTPETYQLVAKIVRAMVDDGCPPDRAMRAERAMLTVLVETMRPVREANQAAALSVFGASLAAETIGVHRATVWRRARRCTKPVPCATAD